MACQRMARRGPTAFLHARSNAVYHADGCTPAHSAAHPAAPCWPYRMPNGRWRAQFTHRNKVIQIGMFDSEEEVRGVPVDWMHSTECRWFCSVGCGEQACGRGLLLLHKAACGATAHC